MNFNILTIIADHRVDGLSVSASVTIKEYLQWYGRYGKQNKLDEQRPVLKTRSANMIRRRLIEDLKAGAVVPPIVLGFAYNSDIHTVNAENVQEVLNKQLADMTVIDGMLKEGESVTLKGEQALTYIRSRQGLANSTNLERMKRQRQYVDAFLEQTRAAIEENDSLVSDMLASVSEYLVSDLTASKWMTLSDVLHSYTYSGIATIDGEARKGEQYMEFRADEAALKKLVIDTFFVEK